MIRWIVAFVCSLALIGASCSIHKEVQVKPKECVVGEVPSVIGSIPAKCGPSENGDSFCCIYQVPVENGDVCGFLLCLLPTAKEICPHDWTVVGVLCSGPEIRSEGESLR